MRFIHRASRAEEPRRLADFAIRAGAALAALALGQAVREILTSNEDALRAVLFPAAQAIRLLFGRDYYWQDGSGFVIRDAGAFLGGDCSGSGWFALALPIVVFLFFPRAGAAGSRSLALARFLAAAIGVCAAAAFLSNLVRVLASQALGPLKLALGLDFYSAHNAEGMLISVAALLFCLRHFERRPLHG